MLKLPLVLLHLGEGSLMKLALSLFCIVFISSCTNYAAGKNAAHTERDHYPDVGPSVNDAEIEMIAYGIIGAAHLVKYVANNVHKNSLPEL